MKKLCAFLLSILTPIVAIGDIPVRDGCMENSRYKSEYTIDRRCYVTEEQKQTPPYNAVVGILDSDNDVYCTGTIVKRNDGYFLYTADHCTDDNNDHQSDKIVRIKLQDGRTFDTLLADHGDQYNSHFYGHFNDWAIYKIPVKKDDNTLPFVQTSSFKDGKTQIVGNGVLGILSDEQIKQVKDAYVRYLIKAGVGNDEESLQRAGYLTTDGGIIDPGAFFLSRWYKRSLKVSNCELSKGQIKGCQIWNADSGGPLFNDHGEIMGIAVTGEGQVGGAEHLKAGLVVGVYSDKEKRSWVASSGFDYNHHAALDQYYGRQEREVAAKIEQKNKKDVQDAIRQAQQNRVENFYLNNQNQQMMIKMAGEYQ